jgi:hypothetical protein
LVYEETRRVSFMDRIKANLLPLFKLLVLNSVASKASCAGDAGQDHIAVSLEHPIGGKGRASASTVSP